MEREDRPFGPVHGQPVSEAADSDAAHTADAPQSQSQSHSMLGAATASLGRGVLQRKLSARIQRKETAAAADIDQKEIDAALAWAKTEKIGPEAVTEVQKALKITAGGHYDEATVHAVFNKQREWHKSGKVPDAGKATKEFFQRLGLIFTHEIHNATVDDAVLATVMKQYPHGVTVAIYPDFVSGVHDAAEFGRQATVFAKNQSAVGLNGSSVVIGVPIVIKEIGNVLEIVQGIHRGLLEKYQAKVKGTPEEKTLPDCTRVKNLALFSHGEGWGVGMNSTNDFSKGGLHNKKTNNDLNPPNVEAFARGLKDAVVSDVRVQLFACSTGSGAAPDSKAWLEHTQNRKLGEDSFGESMAQAFGPEASVYAHTTVGHTTENYAARVFGKEGGGTSGLHLFDTMYPDSYIQEELKRLFPKADDDERAGYHDALREAMWAQYRDSITGEQGRTKKRYAVPMGQECFANPDHARELLHADFQSYWMTPDKVKALKPAPKKKK